MDFNDERKKEREKRKLFVTNVTGVQNTPIKVIICNNKHLTITQTAARRVMSIKS